MLPGEGKSQLQRNQDNLKLIETLVRVETAALVALGIMAFVLAFLVEQGSRLSNA